MSGAVFSPKEAAELSGVSSDVQREWRRRDLMPFTAARENSREWNAFNLRQVSALTIMRVLSECGVPLDRARKMAMAAAPNVLTFIADSLDEKARQAFKKQNRISRSAKQNEPELFVAMGVDSIPQVTNSVDNLFHNMISPAVISLNLKAVADLLSKRAKKPFVDAR